MKKIILAFLFAGTALSIIAQCVTPCLPGVAPTNTYYLDVDGDTHGDPNEYILCCDLEAPFHYVTAGDDNCPLNRSVYNFNEQGIDNQGSSCDITGCTQPDACNYNKYANVDNNQCVYASDCEECDNPNNDGLGDIKEFLGRCSCVDLTYRYDKVGNCADPNSTDFCNNDEDEDGWCDDATGNFSGTWAEGSGTSTTGNESNADPCLLSTCNERDAINRCNGNCILDVDGDGLCDSLVWNSTAVDLWPACYDPNTSEDPMYDGSNAEDSGWINRDLCSDSLACNFFYDIGFQDNEPCQYWNEVCKTCGEAVDTIPNTAYWVAVSAEGDTHPQFANVATYGATGGNGICDALDLEGCVDSLKCNYDAANTWGLESFCDTFDVCGACGGDAAYNTEGVATSGFVGDDNRCGCNQWVQFPYQNKAPYNDCTEKECVNDTIPNTAYWQAVSEEGADHPDFVNVATYLATGGNGTCDEEEVIGCTDIIACNYDASATTMAEITDCLYIDATGICGGTCQNDSDSDGLCDADDPCPDHPYTSPDLCGTCGGTGYPSGACNCQGWTLDELGRCLESTSAFYCHHDIDDDGICDFDGYCPGGDSDGDGICDGNSTVNVTDPCTEGSGVYDEAGVCNGTCVEDVDQDGVCDDIDPCTDGTGLFDACDVCNGPGYPAGFCNCEGTYVYDAIDNCVDPTGADYCVADVDGDNVCDDIDPCVGHYDVCGKCNENGIPEGDCDCFGNQYDAVNNCVAPGTLGFCTTDADGDGICDHDTDNDGEPQDPCTVGNGKIDECGVCNGPGGLEDCGCAASRAGYCNCEGDVWDDCNVCGGPGRQFARDCNGNCLNDSDGDLTCDEEEQEDFTPHVSTFQTQSGSWSREINPINLQRTANQLERLLSDMHYDLSLGALRHTSLSATLDEQIISKGTFDNYGDVEIGGNMNARNVRINGNFLLEGDLDVDGWQLSDGGLVTSNLNLSSQMVTGGNGNLANLYVRGRAALRDTVTFRSGIDVHQGLESGVVSDSVVFSIKPRLGELSTVSSIGVEQDLTVNGRSELENLKVTQQSNLNEVHVENLFDINAAASVRTNFRVNEYFGATSASPTAALVTIGDSLIPNTGNLTVGGELVVTGNVEIKKDLTIEGVTFSDGGVDAKWLTVNGDVDAIGGNTTAGSDLNVYRNAVLNNNVTIAGDLDLTSTVWSDSSFTGTERLDVSSTTKLMRASLPVYSNSLSVTDTIGVSGTLQAFDASSAGPVQVDGSLNLSGSTTFSKQVTVSGDVEVSGTLKSPAGSGTLKVNGAAMPGGSHNAEINAKFLTDAGFSNTSKDLTITGQLDVKARGPYVASFENESTGDNQTVMQVKINNAKPGNANRYFSFRNSQNQEVGRIQGERVQVNLNGYFANANNELESNSDYSLDKLAYNYGIKNAQQDYTSAEVAYWMSVRETALAWAEVAAEATSFSGCFGITFVWAVFFPVPVPWVATCNAQFEDAAKDLTDVAVATANQLIAYGEYVSAFAGVTQAGEDQSKWINAGITDCMRAVDNTGSLTAQDPANAYTYGSDTQPHWRVGVTYQSGAGDYAEWLPKMNAVDDFEPGQVAGIHEGELSFRTEGAERLVVISTNPIVLGNMPEDDHSGYEKAAFMGQVPVRVNGRVNYGDYLIASGKNDGSAVALSKKSLQPSQLKDVIGVAWERGISPFRNIVNCSVGFNKDRKQVVQNLSAKSEEISSQVDKIKDKLSFWYSNQENNESYTAGDMVAAGQIQSPLTTDEETGQISIYQPGIDDVTMRPVTSEAIEKSVDEFLLKIKKNRMEGYSTNLLDDFEEILLNPVMRRDMINMLEVTFDRQNRRIIETMEAFEGKDPVKISYIPPSLEGRIPEEALGEDLRIDLTKKSISLPFEPKNKRGVRAKKNRKRK
jgi:cytoskeletal protein CcmA (bactofilin family)